MSVIARKGRRVELSVVKNDSPPTVEPKVQVPETLTRVAADKKKALPELHQHILQAFETLARDNYLVEVARSHPTAFLGLLVKVLPLQAAGEGGSAGSAGAAGGSTPLKFDKIERVIVYPAVIANPAD